MWTAGRAAGTDLITFHRASAARIEHFFGKRLYMRINTQNLLAAFCDDVLHTPGQNVVFFPVNQSVLLQLLQTLSQRFHTETWNYP